MTTDPFRRFLWLLSHRRYKSPADYFRKRTRFGEINEFVGFQVISSNSTHHTLPFLTNPFRSKVEKDSWNVRAPLDYEYPDEGKRREALGHFEIAYDLVKDRIPNDAVIFDVGCSAGFFLEKWREKGFENLYGLDPLAGSVKYAQNHRPHLNIKTGYFGPEENDVPCDVLVFFQTVFRIPYEDQLFKAIERCARKYVLISWVEDGTNLFTRDLHVGLARTGFICIEKRVVSDDLMPFGIEGADYPMIKENDDGDYIPSFVSHYLFRRVDI